ncbi:MAG: L,D-transpeptidase family protein [Prosthecobacter sp.]
MIPAIFTADLTSACRQVLLVIAPGEDSTTATLRLLERRDSESAWQQHGETIPVTIGRKGFAWGLGEHRSQPPAGFRYKREGDGCAPAGIFRVSLAFGEPHAAPPGCKLPYLPISDTLLAIDDPESRYYNQIIDSAKVPAARRDWTGAEVMHRTGGLYRWGIVVAHNPQNQPGHGSCIFMHLWLRPGHPTSGCTAMSEENILRVLQWLDPAKEPRLVQGIG